MYVNNNRPTIKTGSSHCALDSECVGDRVDIFSVGIKVVFDDGDSVGGCVMEYKGAIVGSIDGCGDG